MGSSSENRLFLSTRGQRIELRGFGVFQVKQRKKGIGRNPKTGVEVKIPPGNTIRFKPGKELRNLLYNLDLPKDICNLKVPRGWLLRDVETGAGLNITVLRTIIFLRGKKRPTSEPPAPALGFCR